MQSRGSGLGPSCELAEPSSSRSLLGRQLPKHDTVSAAGEGHPGGLCCIGGQARVSPHRPSSCQEMSERLALGTAHQPLPSNSKMATHGLDGKGARSRLEGNIVMGIISAAMLRPNRKRFSVAQPAKPHPERGQPRG